MINFTTKDGSLGRIKLLDPEQVGMFICHALRLGDTITKIERVQ